jgi:Glycosyltransferase family 87
VTRRLAGAVPAVALLVAGWALTLWVMPWSDERVNDLFVYRTFAEPFLSGSLPYRDIAFEYPPLAAPLIGLPGVLGTGEEAFRLAFAAWTLAGGVAVVLSCGSLARATGGDPRRAMLAAALMPLLCGALLRTHFDLFPVAILLGGLLLVACERPRAGLAVLGIGAMTKAFPLVAVPVVLVWLVARGRRREAWQGALACAAAIAVVAAAAVAASPSGAFDAVEYHLERPAQIESSPALTLLGLDAVGLGEATSVSSHRSDGLEHPAAGAITSVFTTALVALVALLCVAMAVGRAGPRAPGRAGAAGARRDLVLACLAALVAFAALGKVLSPQFMIWALPLGALAFAWRRHALAAAVALAALLTQLEFPAHYFDVVEREPAAIALVALRNAVLLGVVLLAFRELQPRRHQELLDGRRPALAVRLD